MIEHSQLTATAPEAGYLTIALGLFAGTGNGGAICAVAAAGTMGLGRFTATAIGGRAGGAPPRPRGGLGAPCRGGRGAPVPIPAATGTLRMTGTAPPLPGMRAWTGTGIRRAVDRPPLK